MTKFSLYSIFNVNYRKIPKIGPPKYKPPKPLTQKNPPLNSPSKYKPPRGLIPGKLPLNTKQNKAKLGNLLPTIRLAQSILKPKFPSVDKPLRIKAPPKISLSKRALEKHKPWGLFPELYGISWYFCRKTRNFGKNYSFRVEEVDPGVMVLGGRGEIKAKMTAKCDFA